MKLIVALALSANAFTPSTPGGTNRRQFKSLRHRPPKPILQRRAREPDAGASIIVGLTQARAARRSGPTASSRRRRPRAARPSTRRRRRCCSWSTSNYAAPQVFLRRMYLSRAGTNSPRKAASSMNPRIRHRRDTTVRRLQHGHAHGLLRDDVRRRPGRRDGRHVRHVQRPHDGRRLRCQALDNDPLSVVY